MNTQKEKTNSQNNKTGGKELPINHTSVIKSDTQTEKEKSSQEVTQRKEYHSPIVIKTIKEQAISNFAEKKENR